MSSKGLRLSLWFLCFLGGCTSVPPAPEHARNVAPATGDEHEGWLWNTLSGQKKAPEPAQTPASQNPVVAASAELPGPLIPGPASRSAGRMGDSPNGPAISLAGAELPAGPPPSIPAELPGVPSGAVSIDKLKVKEEKKGFELSDLAPENIYKNMKNAAGYGPDEKIARAAMQEGKALFDAKKYLEAAPKFAIAADRWPDSPLEEDALFLKGECEFFSDLYPKAHDTFGGLLKKYANTRHLDTVVYREFAMGRYWEQLHSSKPIWPVTPNVTDHGRPMFDTFGYAVQAFQRVREHDPTGPLADHALMALGNAYFRQGQFEEAAYNYDLLRKEYPNSKHQMLAHVLELQTKMRIYQGSWYDGTPLNEAGKIADQALAQFGDKLGAERDRVAQARAQIAEEKANREFNMAQFYDGRKEFRAARIYYKSLIDDFPGTSKAKEAQARMEQIKGEPDVPPERLAWLTGMFDSKKR